MDRLTQIRKAEKESHEEVYCANGLYEPGSWLAKPAKTVLDILPLYRDYGAVRALDLGSGVGRNSIPVARFFADIPCRVDCVDILEMAVDKLRENAARFGVADAIHGIVSAIDDYAIAAGCYDLILAISALEHVDSEAAFCSKLAQIRDGIRGGGMACLVVNSDVQERDKVTGKELQPQFEVNMPTAQLQSLLERVFTGWETVKQTVVHQKYDIPRGSGTAVLEADVVTYVTRKPQ